MTVCPPTRLPAWPRCRLSHAQRAAFRAALDDYIAVQRFNADRGEAHMNLAWQCAAATDSWPTIT